MSETESDPQMRELPETWAIPSPNEATREWFTGGRLAVQSCAECKTTQHPPGEVCHRCGSAAFTSIEMAPLGTIHSFTIVHHAVNDALAESVPYAVVLVALDDAPTVRVVGNMAGCSRDDVRIGAPVEAFWQSRHIGEEHILLPQWRPRGG